jgi:hypothetical protein
MQAVIDVRVAVLKLAFSRFVDDHKKVYMDAIYKGMLRTFRKWVRR